jgi:RHS repeat-associated protein
MILKRFTPFVISAAALHGSIASTSEAQVVCENDSLSTTIAADTGSWDPDPGSVLCIELKPDGLSEPVALVQRYGAVVKLTQNAVRIVKMSSGGEDWWEIQQGHDLKPSSTDSCTADTITNEFHLALDPNATGCGTQDSLIFSDLRGATLNDFTCTDCQSTPVTTTITPATQVAVTMTEDGLVWAYPGPLGSAVCGPDPSTPNPVYEACLITENNGTGGAVFSIRVESNGYVSEVIVAVIEAFGIENSGCSGCPSAPPPLGACYFFEDGVTLTCDCIDNMTEEGCYLAGGDDWDPGDCGTIDTTVCTSAPIHDFRLDANGATDTNGEFGEDECGDGGPNGGRPSVGGSRDSASHPIEHVTGNKIENVADFSVSVPGMDYTFRRMYRGASAATATLDGVGNGWVSPDFMYLQESSTNNDLYIYRGINRYVFKQSGSIWEADGPTDQYIERDVYFDGNSITPFGGNGVPVYQLVDPDGRRWLFHRDAISGDSNYDTTIPASVIGYPFAIMDGRGGLHRYHYIEYGGPSDPETTTPTARLDYIELQDHTGSAIGDTGFVDFEWNTGSENPNRGTLKRITASVRNLAGTLEVVEIVDYTYADDLFLPFQAWSHLATRGDLIQVTRRTRLDDAATGESVFRERITQYRYHLDGDTEDTGIGVDSDNDGVPSEAGAAHQLRMVFTPFEIEHFAEQSGAPSVAQAGRNLLYLADGDLAYGTTSVAQLASKIVARYDGDKVEVQYIQASCGCTSTSTGRLGIERIHDYWMDDTTLELSTYFTSWYEERADLNGDGDFLDTGDLYRTIVTHHEKLNGIPVLVAESVLEPASTNAWVRKYEYDSNGNLQIEVMPSAIDYLNYDANLGTTAWSISTHSGQGMVMGYTYNSDNMLTGTYVRAGYSAASNIGTSTSGWHAIETYEYGVTGRPDLVSAVNRYRTAEEVPGSAAPNNVERAVFEYYFYDNDSPADYVNYMANAVAMVKTKVERELASENGPSGTGTYDSIRVLDLFGRTVVERAADDTITETVYETVTGGVSQMIRNIDGGDLTWSAPSISLSDMADFPSGTGVPDPTTWGRTDGGDAHVTTYDRDLNGRVVITTRPDGVKRYTFRTMSNAPWRGSQFNDSLLYYSEITLPHIMDSLGEQFNGVATQTWTDAAGAMVERQEFELQDVNDSFDTNPNDYRAAAVSIVDTAAPTLPALLVGRTATESDFVGKSIDVRRWHDVTEVAGGPYIESATFDEFGRLESSTDANGNITVFDYDIRDRQTRIRFGTSMAALDTATEMFYDSAGSTTSGVGDGNLTLQRSHVDSNVGNHRDTEYKYDNRNRLVWTINELAPHSYSEYDNIGRVTKRHVSSVAPTAIEEPAQSNRIASSYTYYSQRGLVWQSSQEIDPTSAPNTDVLISRSWFDQVGRVVKSQPPNGLGSKTAYDALGRATHRFVGDMSGDSGYTDVYDATNFEVEVGGDTILEESVTRYITSSSTDGFGQPDLMTHYQRAHDASSTGSLSSFDGTGLDSTAIRTFTQASYDAASRPVESEYFGTNDSDGFVAQGPTPNGTTSGLVSETIYDAQGRAYVAVAPDGTRSRTIFDDLDRAIAVIENDQSGTMVTLSWNSGNSRWSTTNAGGATSAQNRVTSFVYDGLGNTVRRVAHVEDSAVQETVYDYDYSNADFDSNSLLAAVHYPDESTGAANTATAYTVSYEYNRLGEVTEMTDQNQTTHAYTYDAMGKITSDAVTSFGTDIDQTVHEIEYTYSTATGLLEEVTSLDSAGTTVLNEIRFEYDDMLALSKYRQNPTGAVGTGQSADVEYLYDREDGTSSGNFSRLNKIKYPLVNTGGNQRTEVAQYYGDPLTANLDDRISRSVGLDWTFQMKAAATDKVRYEHLGLNNTVLVDYPDGKIKLDRWIDSNYTPAGGASPSVSGEYAGMDKYGRLERQVWYRGTSWDPDNLPARLDVKYVYDDNSDITRRYDSRVGASMADRGDEYSYDGLNRLTLATRGAPATSGGIWNSASKTEDWDLDIFGNWDSYDNDLYAQQIAETRTHNQANELTQNTRTIDSDPAVDLDMTYDDAGNLRTREVSDTVRWVYTWDAWNRLVAVQIQEFVSGAWEPEVDWVDRMESGYYGLNQRAWSRIDEGAAGYVTGGPSEELDREEHFYYDASWRLLERRTDVGPLGTSFTHDQTTQWVWGNRYIDELVAYAVDTNASSSQFDAVEYAMTDRNFSVIGLVDGERVRYDAYGYAQASPFGDANGDGTVDGDDQKVILDAFGTTVGGTGYQVEGDLNANGTVDLTDLNLYSTASGDSIDRGDISGIDNIVGYAGYAFEPATKLYIVRNRWFSPASGRWMSRDPIGFAGSSYLYEYVQSRTTRFRDPLGLAPYVEGYDPPIMQGWRKAKYYSDQRKGTGSNLSMAELMEIRARAIATIGGGRLKNMPDAADFLLHFLYGGGRDKNVDYERLINEDGAAEAHYHNEINRAMSYAEQLARDDQWVYIAQTGEVGTSASTRNWFFALGGYGTWGRGRVFKCKGKPEYTMELELNLNDFYDWERYSLAKGGLVTDGEMSELHHSKLDIAEEYRVKGKITVSVKWTHGQRFGVAAITVRKHRR